MTPIQSHLFQPGISLSYGCMRLPHSDPDACRTLLETALAAGFRQFDHADIYASGACERAFGKLWGELGIPRENLAITSKCGIRFAGEPGESDPKRYDFSRSYILDSVAASLQRLQTEYLDCLLLHRPDYLMPVEEVAEAFNCLHADGRVRQFGVSNFTPSQVDLLNDALQQPLVVNQIEVSLLHLDALHDGSLDQCQRLGMSVQAWSPLRGSFGTPRDVREQRLQAELAEQAARSGCEPWVLALAWLRRHPAAIVPVIGTTNRRRIQQSLQALDLTMARSDWYRLLQASLGREVA